MSPRVSTASLVFSVVFFATSTCAVAAGPQSQQSAPVKTDNGRIVLGVSTPQSAPAASGGDVTDLQTADRLLANGKVAEAQAKYQEIAKRNPGSAAAQAGIIRTYSVQSKWEEANAAAEKAVVQHPNSLELLLAVGDLQFAQGKIPEAERSYIKAENAKPSDPMPYVCLARVYRAYSLYRRAYDNMKHAHDLAPNNVPVQLLWFNSLPQQDRIASLESFLKSPGLNPPTTKTLQQYLAFLKRNSDEPVHPCTLVSNVKETEVKLYPIVRAGSELGAVGLNVKMNKQEMHLALDTGGSGVLLGRAAAERLGLQRLGYHPIVGMGDSGHEGGYTSVADRIRIGDLEFSDCIVRVTDKAAPVTGQDGLVGTDVFAAYLVDMDIPGAKLRLSPLPKRPEEAAAPTALRTMSHESQELETEGPITPRGPGAAPDLPKDAYVAPEMANWTKIYHFRNLLLVPTKVDNNGPMLFLIDTGSYNNVLSTETARRLAQLRADPATRVTGFSGSVAKVYRADKATLQFGRYEQENQDVVTFDLSSISRQTGTQVSGILGFNMLRILQIKIDYRDGLIDFLYDPKRLPKQIKLNN